MTIAIAIATAKDIDIDYIDYIDAIDIKKI